MELHPLTLADALFGSDALGIEGIPRHTSAGTLWRELGYADKTDCFKWGEGVDPKRVELKEEFRQAVELLITSASLS